MDTELREEVFAFLDSLRESGSINMMGARPYVAEAFELDTHDSGVLFREWMHTFAERHPEEAS